MSLPVFAGNISSCTQHSRRAAPLDPSPVMQSCAARLNARLTKQSVNCELLCIIALSTYQRVQAALSRLHDCIHLGQGVTGTANQFVLTIAVIVCVFHFRESSCHRTVQNYGLFGKTI